jgi:hypothetical protein
MAKALVFGVFGFRTWGIDIPTFANFLSVFFWGPMIQLFLWTNGIVSFTNFQTRGQEPGRPPEAEWDPHIWAEEADRAAGSNWSKWSNFAI